MNIRHHNHLTPKIMFSTAPLTPDPILSLMNEFQSISLDDAVLLSELPEDQVREKLDLMVSCELLTVGSSSADDSHFYERVE